MHAIYETCYFLITTACAVYEYFYMKCEIIDKELVKGLRMGCDWNNLFLVLCGTMVVIGDSGQNGVTDTVYTLGFMKQLYEFNFRLYITSFIKTTLSVSEPLNSGVQLQSLDVNADSVVSIEVKSSLQVDHGTSKQRKALYISSSSKFTLVVFDRNSEYGDAFLAFPVSNYCACRYITVTSMPYMYYPVNVIISPLKSNTVLAIRLPKHVVAMAYGEKTYRSLETIHVVLNKYEVFHVESFYYDLTGIEIHSDSPVSVYSGSLCGYVPSNSRGTCSHMVEQIPPVSSWGNRYITVPFAAREGGDIFKITAAYNQTEVTFHNRSFTLNAHEYKEVDVPSNEPGLVIASRPILVVQLWKSYGATPLYTNPFMVLVPPVDRYLSAYDIVSPTHARYHNYSSYANIVVLTNETYGIQINGSTKNISWNQVPDTDFSVTAYPLPNGVLRFSHQNSVPFGLQIYGFINGASYGYVGGWDLTGDQNNCECLQKPSETTISTTTTTTSGIPLTATIQRVTRYSSTSNRHTYQTTTTNRQTHHTPTSNGHTPHTTTPDRHTQHTHTSNGHRPHKTTINRHIQHTTTTNKNTVQTTANISSRLTKTTIKSTESNLATKKVTKSDTPTNGITKLTTTAYTEFPSTSRKRKERLTNINKRRQLTSASKSTVNIKGPYLIAESRKSNISTSLVGNKKQSTEQSESLKKSTSHTNGTFLIANAETTVTEICNPTNLTHMKYLEQLIVKYKAITVILGATLVIVVTAGMIVAQVALYRKYMK